MDIMADSNMPNLEQQQLAGGVISPIYPSLPQTPDQTQRGHQRNKPFGKPRRKSDNGAVLCAQSSPILQDSSGLSPPQAAPRRASLGSNSSRTPDISPSLAPSTPIIYPVTVPSPHSPAEESKVPEIEVIVISDDEPPVSPQTTRRNPSRSKSASPKSSSPTASSPSPQSKQPKPSPKQRSPRSATRPAHKPRSATDPLPLGHEPRSLQDIDAQIASLIRDPVDLGNTKNKKGFVYVFPAKHLPSGKLLVKIGHTIQRTGDRKGNIKAACRGTLNLQAKNYLELQIADFYKRVERLAHADLAEFCRPFDCACGGRHHEFFEIDEKTARRTVERWIRFCGSEPWMEAPAPAPAPAPTPAPAPAAEKAKICTGPLKPWWADRLRRCREEVDAAANAEGKAGIKRAGVGEEGKDSGYRLARREHWARFVDGAGGSAWLEYERRLWWSELWRFRWQAFCGVLATFWLDWVVWMRLGLLVLAVGDGVYSGRLVRESVMGELIALWRAAEAEPAGDNGDEGPEGEIDGGDGKKRWVGPWVDGSDGSDGSDCEDDGDSENADNRKDECEAEGQSDSQEDKDVDTPRRPHSFVVPDSEGELWSDDEGMDVDD